jgi:hypothetical protein
MFHAFTKLFDRVGRMTPARELPPSQGFILHSPPELPVMLEPRL